MENNYPLISIIVPTYNRSKTLPRMINSILEQTYKNFELLIVDDCSTDDSDLIVMSFCRKDSRVKYYKLNQNHGACFARNFGFEKSVGEYIALMDSDDVCHVDRIQKQLDHTILSKCDFSFCGINRVENDNCSYFYPIHKIDFNKNVFEQELIENRICSVAMFMKRQVFNCIKFDTNLKRYQDWDFALRVSKVFSTSFLDEALVDSTIQSDSISKNISHYESLLAIYEKYQSDIEKNRRVSSKFHEQLGDSLRRTDFKKAKYHYKKSLEKGFSLKTLVKTVLSTIRIKF